MKLRLYDQFTTKVTCKLKTLILVITLTNRVAECQESTTLQGSLITNDLSTQNVVGINHNDTISDNCSVLKSAFTGNKTCDGMGLTASQHSKLSCVMNSEKETPNFCRAVKRCPKLRELFEDVYTNSLKAVSSPNGDITMYASLGSLRCSSSISKISLTLILMFMLLLRIWN